MKSVFSFFTSLATLATLIIICTSNNLKASELIVEQLKGKTFTSAAHNVVLKIDDNGASFSLTYNTYEYVGTFVVAKFLGGLPYRMMWGTPRILVGKHDYAAMLDLTENFPKIILNVNSNKIEELTWNMAYSKQLVQLTQAGNEQ